MQSDFEGTPHGQIEEGIEKVAWLNPEQIKEALKNSYENIKLLFEEDKSAPVDLKSKKENLES
ncbi:hypothetical protein D9M71_799660 [compost metagenome]